MFYGGVNLYNTSSVPTGKERGKVDVCLRAEGEGRQERRKGEYKTQPKTYFTHRQNRLQYKALDLTCLVLKGNHARGR